MNLGTLEHLEKSSPRFDARSAEGDCKLSCRRFDRGFAWHTRDQPQNRKAGL